MDAPRRRRLVRTSSSTSAWIASVLLVCCGAVEPTIAKGGSDHARSPLPVDTLLLDANVIAGPRLSKEALQRPVVLDFWATWCAPCVATLPHLEKLARDFGGQISVVVVTDEEPALVTAFLRGRTLGVSVITDSKRSLFEHFDIRGIPMTVILDRKQKEWARSHPIGVTAGALDAVIANRAPGPGLHSGAQQPPVNEQLARASLHAAAFSAIVPSASRTEEGSSSAGRYSLHGATLRSLISLAYNIQATRITFEGIEPMFRYDFYFTPARAPESFREVLKQQLSLAFQLEGELQQRDADVLVLKAVDRSRQSIHTGEFRGSSINRTPEGMQASGITYPALAQQLELALATPVLVAESLDATERFDVVLSWGHPSVANISAALRSATGMALSPERRPVELFSVEKVVPGPGL